MGRRRKVPSRHALSQRNVRPLHLDPNRVLTPFRKKQVQTTFPTRTLPLSPYKRSVVHLL